MDEAVASWAEPLGVDDRGTDDYTDEDGYEEDDEDAEGEGSEYSSAVEYLSAVVVDEADAEASSSSNKHHHHHKKHHHHHKKHHHKKHHHSKSKTMFIINATAISDEPRYKHRGLLIDTARHFLPVDIIKVGSRFPWFSPGLFPLADFSSRVLFCLLCRRCCACPRPSCPLQGIQQALVFCRHSDKSVVTAKDFAAYMFDLQALSL